MPYYRIYQKKERSMKTKEESDKAKRAFPWNKENPSKRPANQDSNEEDLPEGSANQKHCIWAGFEQAEEFLIEGDLTRYFRIECPDCRAKQVYQMVNNSLYVIQSEHQC
jgi:hypothetical protein